MNWQNQVMSNCMIKIINDYYRDAIFHVCDQCKTEKEYFGLFEPN